ncbi:winged helix-turn-helix domain-containing protein [Stutzerimonas stutzeri]|uniref:winged helix-turn-helix domain-containing protein n=1 Tax=Stutzerimonas stutzeri TaxID=316 RepID=UPI000838A096|nr:winged helix-turn-helix domain-containing protein [Stutzerimonas stutzeri]MBO0640654.1 winged helix-turn-helix domain-containing protein [Stutzerimonas stutzeri]MDH0497124.1 winged helix-turn-helix domain-containing protein [Stutzerimonas stutzeri]OCX58961.1 CadC family transcriptional regulator [Stutzerimonas stutzeri]RRW08902.1 CadC family transcriptional regulator [Stutzerimonas stutzeri]WGG16947.1 winged helix-turn-helix domain-containing protein [Stutzerimonas stutzeri]
MISSLTTKATDGTACPLLKCGRDGRVARFDRSLYQLMLISGEDVEKVDLGFSGSRVLERLLQTPGEVVSREELLRHAWEDRVVGQGSLNQQIYTLRQLLSDSASQIIQTLPRRGYLFNPNHLLEASETAPVQPSAAAAQPATIIEPHVPAAAAIPRPSPWLAPTVLGTAVALLLAVVALGYRFMHAPKGSLTHSHSIGQLEVLYVEKSQQMLERMMQETRLLVSSIAGLNTHPSRLIVNMSPGFYELRCLRGDGQVNWLKIHRSQVNSISNETLQGCLR